MSKKRVVYFDILKILACFLVIMNHSSSYFLGESYSNIELVITLALSLIYRTAVPLFIMISGALLLGKEEEPLSFYKKRIPKILIPLFVVTAGSFFSNNSFSYDNIILFFRQFLSGNYLFHLWYLYLLIGLYLMTPFIAKLIKVLNDREYKIIIIISLIFMAVIPVLENLFDFSLSISFTRPFFSMYVIYFIIGHYISNRKVSSNQPIASWIVLVTSAICFVIISIADFTTIGETWLDANTYISIALPAICIFNLFKYYFGEKRMKYSNMIARVGGYTFGTYLIHYIFLNKMVFVFQNINSVLPNILATIVFDLSVFAVCMVIVAILKMFPVIKNYL